MRASLVLAFALSAATARGQGYGSQLFKVYYVENPADSICSGAPHAICSIVQCDAMWSCSCLRVLPNGLRQPLTAEQCQAASRGLPHLPPEHFSPPVIPPEAECRWRSKSESLPAECRYSCSGMVVVAKITLPPGMVRCPGEQGAALQWGQIRGVVTDPAPATATPKAPAAAAVPAASPEPAKEVSGKDTCGSCVCFYRGSGPEPGGYQATRQLCRKYCKRTDHGHPPADGMRCTGDKAVQWWN
jgi:hypothetical protein